MKLIACQFGCFVGQLPGMKKSCLAGRTAPVDASGHLDKKLDLDLLAYWTTGWWCQGIW